MSSKGIVTLSCQILSVKNPPYFFVYPEFPDIFNGKLPGKEWSFSACSLIGNVYSSVAINRFL